VYVDKDTCEVKYGVRADAQPNITGPFDCTRQDRRLTLFGWEGFCAVEELPTVWALYFDKDDDGLRSKLPLGTRVLEVELTRKEKRLKMDTTARQQDQATQRTVDVRADAPTDAPISIPPLQQPGARTTPLEPLKMPTSIFVQELQPAVPPPPKTPPPAYTPNFEPAPLSSVTPLVSTSTSLHSTSPGDERATAILNRNRGSRALEQAKRFEKLSQVSNENFQRRNEGLTFFPASDTNLTDLVFDYADSSKTGTKNLDPRKDSDRPDSSTIAPQTPLSEPSLVPQKKKLQSPPTPVSPEPDLAIVPQASKPNTTVSPTYDPAVFRRYEGTISEDKAQQGNSPTNSSMALEKLVQRKSSFKKAPDSRAPKAPLPSLPTASGTRRPGLSSSKIHAVDRGRPDRRGPIVAASNEDLRSTLRSASNRTSPPPQRRRGDSQSSKNEEGMKSTNRAASRTTTVPSLTSTSRQRNNSTSTQRSDVSRSSPRAPTRVATVLKASQPSMNTTMTTGTKNEGMSSRLGLQSDLQRKDMEKTTSALFREIDDFLQLDGSRSGTTMSGPGSAQAPVMIARRPSLFKKVGTATPSLVRGDGSPPPRGDGLGARQAAKKMGNRRSTEKST
jgi:hypothetical protein